MQDKRIFCMSFTRSLYHTVEYEKSHFEVPSPLVTEHMGTQSSIMHRVFLIHEMVFPFFGTELLPGAVFNNILSIICMNIEQTPLKFFLVPLNSIFF